MATRGRILAELEKGGKTTRALMAQFGQSYAAVHTSLKRMRDRGIVAEVKKFGNLDLSEPTWFLTTKIAAALSDAVASAAQTLVTPAPVVGPSPSTYNQAQAQQPPVAQAKKLRTKAILVVDGSYSVSPYRREMNDTVNKTIADLKTESYRHGIEVDFSLYYFSEYNVKTEIFSRNVREVQAQPVHHCWGGTPLFDAVIRAITDHLQPERADEDISYLLLVITDGEDNQSRDRYGRPMKELIGRVQGTDRWTVTFQMPPGKKDAFCRNFGVPEGNCMEWELTNQGLREATAARSVSTSNYMSMRSKGVTSVKAFYTDLSKVDIATLQRNLRNIQDQVKTFTVGAEADIKPFIEAHTGRAYEAGSVFYALTKPELIQDTKKLLIQEKGGRAVYAGTQARQLLGLPVGEDVKVKPGNHGNFELYVQSTSVNRKLVRGTKVVHWPLALQ